MTGKASYATGNQVSNSHCQCIFVEIRLSLKGSRISIAFALRIDSRLPTRANIAIYLMEVETKYFAKVREINASKKTIRQLHQ